MNRFPRIDYDRRPESYWSRRSPEEVLTELLAADLDSDSREERPTAAGAAAASAADHLPGEVEILRITIAGAAPNRISVRARPVPSGRIAYRIVDDRNRFYAPEPAFSDASLSFGELVDLLERARPDGTLRGALLGVLRRTADPVAEAEELLTVESSCYPEARRHYLALARALGEEARIPQMRYGPRGE